MRPVPALLAAVAVFLLAGCSAGVAPGVSSGSFASGTDPVSGLPIVQAEDLPPEAGATLGLIETGGPFPHDEDGAVFQNREGLLPARGRGYYREYTVPTPGEGDRGARRIVSGADGERYWTADHYASFAWIAP